MKPGKEYEEFIYQKFAAVFPSFDVKINDKIIGQQSHIKREIDVSIKGTINDIEVLYLVQCKDHNKPADVKILGEFSAVIRDIGASKGFLLCTSGFAKTIHNYARSLGIELFTIEDINSSKWSIEIEIPIIYIYKNLEVLFNAKFASTPELAQKNKEALTISILDFQFLSVDKGVTKSRIIDYLNKVIETEKIDIENVSHLELNDPNQLLLFAGVWVPVTLLIDFTISSIYYLKYIKPEEYSQISNHVTNEKLPIILKISDTFILDERYVEINKENIPIASTILIEVEKNLHPINQINIDYSDFRIILPSPNPG